MTNPSTAAFDRQYQTHLKHLKLKGLQPKTIEACSRAIRRSWWPPSSGRWIGYPEWQAGICSRDCNNGRS